MGGCFIHSCAGHSIHCMLFLRIFICKEREAQVTRVLGGRPRRGCPQQFFTKSSNAMSDSSKVDGGCYVSGDREETAI